MFPMVLYQSLSHPKPLNHMTNIELDCKLKVDLTKLPIIKFLCLMLKQFIWFLVNIYLVDYTTPKKILFSANQLFYLFTNSMKHYIVFCFLMH